MTHRQYATTVQEAEYLTQEPVFVFDIETNTDSPIKGWKDYGLSYATDITWISFYVKNKPIVVFDMSNKLDDYDDKVDLLRRIFSRTGYLAVNHNITFDLRLVLGHYGIRIPLGSLVHDTLTIAIMLLMGDNVREGISLKALATKYNLFASREEMEFSEAMKAKRFELHTVEPEKVLRYVALDTELTWRLYELQMKIIECSSSPQIEPRPVVNGSEVDIVLMPVNGTPKFQSTKNWSNLQELLNWEYRISRWCGNQSARGIRLDTDYLKRHRQQLLEEYSLAFNDLFKQVEQSIEPDKLNDFVHMLHWNRILEFYNKGKRRSKIPTPDKYVYDSKVRTSPNIENVKRYLSNTDKIDEWMDFIVSGVNGLPEYKPEAPPYFDLVKWCQEVLIGVDKPDSEDKAVYVVDWLTIYYSSKVLFEPNKIIGKLSFQLFYLFFVCDRSFPTNADIVAMPELVTPHLAELVAQAAEIDYRDVAIKDRMWAIADDSLKFYFPKEKGKADVPLVTLMKHQSKLNRIEEYERHATRDGRIHSIIARKTQTGRATSVTMNLQNNDMHVFRGYVVPDTDERMFIAIDISNAENHLLAMTFGDSALAYACCSGDFHSEMTQVYWPELAKELLESGNHSEFNALRKKSKFVTFGSAYGAGPKKIAHMIGTSKDEAEKLLKNRDRRFSNYSQGREKLTGRIDKAYRDGLRPAFTTLWSGRRVAIPLKLVTYKKEVDGKVQEFRKLKLASYKAINYLPQGGVGEVIWRAIVLAEEYFETNGIEAYVSLQVHDEIVIDCHPSQAFDIAQKVIEIIATVIPEKYRNRTIPATRMLSEVGPENAEKWGWRGNGQPYPLPMDKFVNRWGVHDLPEGESEAPTWVCNYAAGESIEKEIQQARERESDLADVSPKKATLTVDNHWKLFDNLVVDLTKSLNDLNAHRSLAYLTIGDENKGLFDFPNRMLLSQELLHKGHATGEEYWEFWRKAKSLKIVADQISQWYNSHVTNGEETK